MGSRFTLVELMISVAIVTTLAAVAVPVFADMQARSRRSEVLVIAEGIDDAVRGYIAETGKVPTAHDFETSRPTNRRRPWEPNFAWAALGFAPDGQVWCRYAVGGPWTDVAPDAWFLNATCDVDGDGVFVLYGRVATPAIPSYNNPSFGPEDFDHCWNYVDPDDIRQGAEHPDPPCY